MEYLSIGLFLPPKANLAMKTLPEFSSYQEREKWLCEHADYFRVVRRANLHNYSGNVKTLEQAIAMAQRIVKDHPTVRLLVYAVYGISDCWVATVSNKGIEGSHATRTDSSLPRRDV